LEELKMKKTFALILAFFFAFNINTYAMEADIVDIAVGNEDFSVLVAALTEADLVGALQGDGPFTVFAPTDAAFTDLLTALDITAGDLLAHPQLADVLLYHVVSGKIMSTDLSDGIEAATLKGDNITVGVGDTVTINDSTVVIPDIEASNGVIHVIDQVLVPADFKLDYGMMDEPTPEDSMASDMDIVDIALADEQFSMLVMLLQRADLVGALQGDGPFTVFAPTNDAFVELVTALGITPEELMAQPDLAKVLLYHVISGKVMSTDLSDGLEAGTLNGNTIAFDLSDGVKANASNVIAADIIASNGVIHVIDSVLVPADFTYQEVDLAEEDIPEAGVPAAIPIALPLGSLGIAAVFAAKRKFK
jgi:transforming growth factor-beta-induced protein